MSEEIHNYVIGKRTQARFKKLVQMGFTCIQIHWSSSGLITIGANGNYVHPEALTHKTRRDSIRGISWQSVDDASCMLMQEAENIFRKE